MGNFYMDLEFIESGPKSPIQFISIGIVSENDKEYYAVSNEYDESLASNWVKENVLNKLNMEEKNRKSNKQISNEVIRFIGKDKSPLFITYYGAYDHVVFCQLFGAMIDLPESFPKFTYDLKQLAYELGDPELPEQKNSEHNALDDAKWNKHIHKFLLDKKIKKSEAKFNLKKFKESSKI